MTARCNRATACFPRRGLPRVVGHPAAWLVGAVLLLAQGCAPESESPATGHGGTGGTSSTDTSAGSPGTGGEAGDASSDGGPNASRDAFEEGRPTDGAAREDDSAGRADDAAAMDAFRTDAPARDAGPTTPPVIMGCDAMTAHARADLALADMMIGFWNGSTQYLDATEPSDGRMTGYWTFAQAFDAALDGVERGSYSAGLIQTLYSAQNARTWRSDYYDDENWMALALMRAFDMTGNRAYLDRAVALYQEITLAWDDTSAHPDGIWWDRAHTQKATASNAGPVITGVRLAARTGNAAHLAFARKVYEFWHTTMVDATGKVADHILPDGTIARGLLTYNEGLMVGAGLALHEATGEARFRTEAHASAQALVRNETKATLAGRVLHDGTNTSCRGDCPQWKGIGYRYLAAALRDDPTRAEYRAVLQASVEAAWTLGRNPTTGLFANDWAGPTMPTAAIEAESSTVMALNIYAMLCGADPAGPRIGYEAEGATLDHVSLERTNAGFSGWGYVAGWTANRQSVEFTVPAAAAGDRLIEFDYAAAAGDATRALAVNGAAPSPLVFASTGAWTTWRRVGATVRLAAGANAIRLTFDSSTGSANPLNLDRLTLGPP